jgi:hypothetical protein
VENPWFPEKVMICVSGAFSTSNVYRRVIPMFIKHVPLAYPILQFQYRLSIGLIKITGNKFSHRLSFQFQLPSGKLT